MLEAEYKGQKVAVKVLSRVTTDIERVIRAEITPSVLIPQHPNIVRVIAWNVGIDFKDRNGGMWGHA